MARDIYYFVSTFEKGFDYQGGKLVALTPEVCTQLIEAGISYQVLDETCIERELGKDVHSYFFDQIEWFRDFDEFLKKNIEYCRINNVSLATAHYYQIKWLMDSAISYSYVLRCFIQEYAPEKIVHVTADIGGNTNLSIYNIFCSPTTTIAQLLPYVCNSLGIAFDQKTLLFKKQKRSLFSLSLLKGDTKNILLKLNFKSFLSFVRFQKYRYLVRRNKPMKLLSILFLHAGCFSVDDVIRQSLFAGAQVFTMGKDIINRENGIMHNRTAILGKGDDSAFADAVKVQCLSTAQVCQSQKSLFSWVQQRSGIAVDGFLMPYLKHFISHICYDTIVKAEKFVEFYDRKNIDMVVMRSSSEYDSAFTLIAAKMRSRVKSVCVQHSSTAIDALLWPMTELGEFFDYYLATDGLSEGYFNFYRKYQIMQDCQVKQTAHYYRSIQARYKKKPHQRGRERIIFAPADALADASVGFNNFNVPFHRNGIEYFEYLRYLLEYFSKRQDKFFIFKYRFGPHMIEKVVVPYITSQGYTNIVVESRPLIDCFHLAQRVILDYPSSGLFEAAAAGLPVMSLYKQNLTIWPDAARFFGCSLRPFEDAQEAKEEIERFLDDDPSNYVHRLPLSDDSAIEVLRGIARGGCLN